MSPMYDASCTSCGHQEVDVYEPIQAPVRLCPICETGAMDRTWFTHPPAVIGDKIDVTIKNGVCWSNGEPRRFRSRAELAQATKAAGLRSRVEHIGRPGSDKSPHTTKWT